MLSRSLFSASEDQTEGIIEHITAQFGPKQDAESDEKDIEQPKIKISDAVAVAVIAVTTI